MSTSNQQTLVESGASDRPQILDKGSYVPWVSRFRRFLDNKQEEGERMWCLTEIGPYVRQMITNLDKPYETIPKPISKMIEANKKHCFADIKVMNYLLKGIPNDIYNSVDACKDAKTMWERIKRLMHGSEITEHVRHSRLMNEFDKFATVEGESLTSIPSYSHSPQPYYVTHPSSVIDYEEDYQGELQGDAQEDKLTTAMMNQEVIHDGRVDIQSKNVGYAGNGNRNARRQNRNQAANAGNGLCYNCNAKGHYARNCPKSKVHDAKYFREQMLIAMKDDARGNLNDEENDFMLDNAYGDDTLEELTAAVIMMARIQPADDKGDAEPKYDADAMSEVNASQISLISGMLSKGVHEHTNHEKLKIVINTSDDDQIDSNIIFDDPYVENNGGKDEHDSNAHDQSFDIESLIYNV
ncbi:integrase, catalytic region, zinc finger, CCHC-type containing protein [Tanacetum coccineum]